MICGFCVVDTTNDVIYTKKAGAYATGGKVNTTDGEADKQMLRLILKYKSKNPQKRSKYSERALKHPRKALNTAKNLKK